MILKSGENNMSNYTEMLGNIPKEKFRQTINKLLNECFVLKSLTDTASDYRLIIANQEIFEGVLDLLGYELIIREDQGVITAQNPSGSGRIHFSKFESILLLILRLLYIEKMKELSQVDAVIILIEDIYEKYNMLKIGKFRKEALLSALRSFKRVNLIQNLDRMDNADLSTRIRIYPSILFAITASSLDDVYKLAQDKLTEFSKGEEDDGTDEDID